MNRKWLLPTALAAVLLGMTPPASATSLGGYNLALFLPQTQQVGEDDALFAPVSDYITMNVNDLAQGWLSFHTSAYQRVQLNDVLDNDVTRFELTYGYFDLKTVRDRVDLRVGRQFLFLGVTRAHADSVKVDLHGPAGLNLTLFGGIPVVSEIGGLRGDVTSGGRLSWRYRPERQTVLEVGLSGLHSTQDHDPDQDSVGIDYLASIPGGSWLTLSGHVFYDVLYGDLYDIAAVPMLRLGAATATFRYNRTEPSALLSKASVLSVFSDDVVEELSGTLDLDLGHDVALDASLGRFGYDTGKDAFQAEGNVRFYYGEELSNLLGAGVSWTEPGESSDEVEQEESSFVGFRLFGRRYLFEDSIFADAEGFLYLFDKSIQGKDSSVSTSIDAGFALMKNLELLAGLSYEQNPLLEEEVRGTVRVTYTYFGMIGR